jgi:acetyltransferase-like isoleucine patch superfamily enzyme
MNAADLKMLDRKNNKMEEYCRLSLKALRGGVRSLTPEEFQKFASTKADFYVLMDNIPDLSPIDDYLPEFFLAEMKKLVPRLYSHYAMAYSLKFENCEHYPQFTADKMTPVERRARKAAWVKKFFPDVENPDASCYEIVNVEKCALYVDNRRDGCEPDWDKYHCGIEPALKEPAEFQEFRLTTLRCASIGISRVIIHKPEPESLGWKLVKTVKTPARIAKFLATGKSILAGGACVRLYYSGGSIGSDCFGSSDFDIYCQVSDLHEHHDIAMDGTRIRLITNPNIYGNARLLRYCDHSAGERGEADDAVTRCFGNFIDFEFRGRHDEHCDNTYYFTKLGSRDGIPSACEIFKYAESKMISVEHTITKNAIMSKPAQTIYEGIEPNLDIIGVQMQPVDFIEREFDLNVCKMYGKLNPEDPSLLDLFALYPEELEARILRYAFHPRMTINGAKASTIISRRQKYAERYGLTIVDGSEMTRTTFKKRSKLDVNIDSEDEIFKRGYVVTRYARETGCDLLTAARTMLPRIACGQCFLTSDNENSRRFDCEEFLEKYL